MRKFASTALVALALASPALAQPGPSNGETAATAEAAKFDLDTPVEKIVADPKGKAVLDADLPGLTTHEHYAMFKSMSLRQLAKFSPDKLTPERLEKVEADLAKIG